MSEFYQLVIRQWGPKGIRPRVHIILKGSQTLFNVFFPQSLEQRQLCLSTKSGKQTQAYQGTIQYTFVWFWG